MKNAILSRPDAASAVTYSEEDGKSFVGHHINMDPMVKGASQLRELNALAKKKAGGLNLRHEARIPMPMITDWCIKHGFTFDQWASNAGGNKDDGSEGFYQRDPGVKSLFMRWFKSREFSKLHHGHVTNKRERNWVPGSIASSAVDLTGIDQ